MRILNGLILAALLSFSVFAQEPPGRVYGDLGTTTALANGATFTSPWADVQAYNSIVVAITASHSASFTVQFSPDGVNADSVLNRTYDPTKIVPPERFTIGRQYVRITINNNSGSNMTFLRAQVMAGDKTVLNFPMDGVLPQRADANPVRVDDYKIDVGAGRREGATNWRKFGFNTDIDSATPETVWPVGGRWVPLITARTLEFTSSSGNDTAAGSGVQQVQIVGIGPGRVYQTDTIALAGLGTAATTSTWLAVNRIVPVATGATGVNEGNITVTATTDATVQAYIPAGSGITQQAFFSSPIDRTFLTDSLLVNVRKLAGGGQPRVTIYAYYRDTSVGAILQVFRLDLDTSVENTFLLRPSNPFVVSAGDSLEFVAETNVNDTVVNINFWGTELQDP